VIALLDTRTFLWAAMQLGRLPARVRKAIEDLSNQILLSTVW
jgi:PIN domain nuclease of toxin-antitoxin system